MLRPRAPLDAYRADLAASGRPAFTPDDGTWLLLAELLARRPSLLDAPETPNARDALDALDAEVAAAVERSADEGADEGVSGHVLREPVIADAVLRLADRLESAGALESAYSLLYGLARALPSLDPRRRGLIAASRARIARMAGALDTARGLYVTVARIGRACGDDDLVARSLLGRAVLARRRGNYPDARALFRRALRVATRAGARELAGLAHHGLLIAASVGRDPDTALVHGWRAFELVGNDPARQADLLATLGAVGSEAGHYRAALGAYLGAARRTAAVRVRLPTLAGAALCAAHLGETALLEAVTRAVEGDLARDPLPYERAQALALLAEAWAVGRPATRGEPFAARALEIARREGLHELVARAESVGVPTVDGSTVGTPADGARTTALRVSRPAPARRVLRVLEQLDGADAQLVPAHW